MLENKLKMESERMVKEITRKTLHKLIDDSIENNADTLLIASKEIGTIDLIVGKFDTVEYDWVSTKMTTKLKIVNEVE